ncbi:MAG: hypothetical protein QM793_11795 [Muricomes sp.]
MAKPNIQGMICHQYNGVHISSDCISWINTYSHSLSIGVSICPSVLHVPQRMVPCPSLFVPEHTAGSFHSEMDIQYYSDTAASAAPGEMPDSQFHQLL